MCPTLTVMGMDSVQTSVGCSLYRKQKKSVDPRHHYSSFVNIRLMGQVFRDRSDDVEKGSMVPSQDGISFTRSNPAHIVSCCGRTGSKMLMNQLQPTFLLKQKI